METNRPGPENSHSRQEMLNGIYSRFLNFPAIDVDTKLIDPNKPDTEDNRRVVSKFVYYFPEGTTTKGYTDQISGTYTIATGEFVIFYAKGIFATRITLKKNSETQDVDLVKSAVFKKSGQGERGGGGASMVPAVTESREPRKPYLHAAESLLEDLEKEMKRNPKLFKNGPRDSLLTEAEKAEKKYLAERLGSVLVNDLNKKRAREEAVAAKKRKNRSIGTRSKRRVLDKQGE